MEAFRVRNVARQSAHRLRDHPHLPESNPTRQRGNAQTNPTHQRGTTDPSSPPAISAALASARSKIDRLFGAGFALSRNDRKIIRYGQLLTTLAAAPDAAGFGPIVDAEVTLGTDDRQFCDYAARHGRELPASGIDRIEHRDVFRLAELEAMFFGNKIIDA